MDCSAVNPRGLFQGCQIGDDVGTILGLRQSPEKHFCAVNIAARICEIGIQCGCSPRGLVRFHRFRIGIVRHTGRLTSHDAPEARSDLVYPDFRGVAVLADVLKNGSSGNRITAGIRRKRRGRGRHQQRRKNYATDHESFPFINFVSRLDAIWKDRWQPVRGDSECISVQIVHARLDVSLRCGLSIRRHRSEVCSGGWQRKTSHVLRDAHAYMLISIPTATSTIFGAFQVMFSSFQVGGIDTCVFHHCMFCVVGAFKHAHPPTELRSR